MNDMRSLYFTKKNPTHVFSENNTKLLKSLPQMRIVRYDTNDYDFSCTNQKHKNSKVKLFISLFTLFLLKY